MGLHAPYVLSTVLGTVALERSSSHFMLAARFDVKHSLCRKAEGALPVAILAFAYRYVIKVDTETICRFFEEESGVSPVKWDDEDITTPYDYFLDKEIDAVVCTTDAGLDAS